MSITVDKKKKVSDMIVYLKQGMSEADAIVLSDMTTNEYVDLRKKFPAAATLIDKAKVQFKLNIMTKMNELANEGDQKAINFLADNASAFIADAVKNKRPEGSANPLLEAFRFVQQNSKPPVKKIGK